MTFSRDRYPIHSAEWDDLDADLITHNLGIANVSTTNARSQTGSRCYALDLNGASKRALLHQLPARASSGQMKYLSCAVGLDVAPSSEMALVYAAAFTPSPPPAHHRHVRIGTDRKLRFYDKNNIQRGPASTGVIPTAGLQELCIAFDGLTLSTLWINVAFGTTWEAGFDTGITWADFFTDSRTLFWGDYLSAAEDRGCTLFIDDGVGQTTADSAEVPHIRQYERWRVNGAMRPDGNGTYTEWLNQAGAAATFAEVDASELPNNDGDTTYWTPPGASRQLVKSSAANPLPVGATVGWAIQRDVGRQFTTKASYLNLLRLGGADLTSPFVFALGTGYLGNYTFDLARPGGGAWIRADFDPNVLEFGVQSTEAAGRCTLHFGPEAAYYTTLLPLAPTPSGAVTPEPNAPPQIEGGKGPLLRPDYNHAMRPTGLLRDIETIRRQTERTIRGERCGRSGSVLVKR